MATAEIIKRHLTCPICWEEYKEPRRLTCQHVYCSKCLQGHINATAGDRYIRRRNEWIIGFNCPECRKTIGIPRPHASSKSRWATQISFDFKTANLQADIREVLSVEQEPRANDEPEKRAKEKRVGPNTRNIHVQTERTEHLQSFKFERKPEHTYAEYLSVVKTKSLPVKKGELVRVISPISDDTSPEMFDLAVLAQGEKRIIVSFDLHKNDVLTFTLDEGMAVVKNGRLALGCKPWRICKISQTQVAITVSEPNGVLVCNIGDDVTIDRWIPYKKRYDGIAMMAPGIFVLTSRDKVHICKDDGHVLREFKVSSPQAPFTDNSYVACTRDQNIVVADWVGNAVLCVTQRGKHIWSWRNEMNLLGVTCDQDGSIYIVDSKAGLVNSLDSRGQFVCQVLRQSEIFQKPSGIAVDGTGYMYVICNKDITVWELRPTEEANM